MNMRELALSGSVLGARGDAAPAPMEEQEFRVLYEETAAALLAYLTRASGNAELAADLLQEAYFHLLRARNLPPEALGRRKYLFRIASNLLHDHWRRSKRDSAAGRELAAEGIAAGNAHLSSEVRAALGQLQPRERQMLWLAYVEQYDQREIAAIMGLRHGSIRTLLFRARHKLAGLLRSGQDVGRGQVK
jgi:RNA polymerase sigma-70 factor (ECF subfamily)